MAAAGRHVLETDSGHIGTISITVRVRRASRNLMKPRIHRVLTQWNPGFTASVSALASGLRWGPRPGWRRVRVSVGLASASGLGPTLVFALAVATDSTRWHAGRTPGRDQARQPRQQRSLGSERGLATPSPDGKGEIPLGPSLKIMPVDSYSTLGRSCEPAFKWIPDPGQAGSGRGPRGGVRCSRVAGPRWVATR
jgi:hypothetical protein